MQLEQERFEAWLFTQPRDRVINAADPYNCVLCSFLKETAQCKVPVFTWDRWHGGTPMDPANPGQPIPDWAKGFVNGYELFALRVQEQRPMQHSGMPHHAGTWDWLDDHITRAFNPYHSVSPFRPGIPVSVGSLQDRYTKMFGNPEPAPQFEMPAVPALIVMDEAVNA